MRSEAWPTPTRTGVRGSRSAMLTAAPGGVRGGAVAYRPRLAGGVAPPRASPWRGRTGKCSASGHPEGPRDEVALVVAGAAADDLHDRVAEVPLERPAAGHVGYVLPQRRGGTENAQRGLAEVLVQLAGEDLGHRCLQARTTTGGGGPDAGLDQARGRLQAGGQRGDQRPLGRAPAADAALRVLADLGEHVV